MDSKELVKKALEALEYSYSPYSHFCVGAALETKNGNVYLGTNIENAAFSATVCAERVAIYNALINGEKEFSAIAVVGGSVKKIENFCNPCGVCRQVMSGFCGKDFKIITFNGKEIKENTLEELLPFGFGSEVL